MEDKLKVVSLFSGSGGLDLGFLETQKFEILFANDWNEQACDTYRKNIGDHVVHDDISNISNPPKADVLIGGPPCQGFSTANPKRSFDDPRNQLFKEYARLLGECNPKVFLMENVSGMMTMEGGRVLELIIKELESCGYRVSWKLLNAVDYGAPQSRRRMILIGIRNDLDLIYKFPRPTHESGNQVTVRDALLNNKLPKNAPNHVFGRLSTLNQERLKFIPEGGSMIDCPEHLRNNSDLKRAMRRLHRDKASYTIVHNNCDHYYHPLENRRITIREMARLQGYPDNFEFQGSKSEQSRQVGNSVPIPLSRALANSIYRILKET